jgi:hypothetical protein
VLSLGLLSVDCFASLWCRIIRLARKKKAVPELTALMKGSSTQCENILIEDADNCPA